MKKLVKKIIFKFYSIFTRLRWYYGIRNNEHSLPSELVVSFTSYADRFNTLPLTIMCLMTQTFKPDRLILWIAKSEADLITEEIRYFTNFGLQIRFCDDLKSFKKIIPALIQYPDAFIVTADDDLYYHSRWLEDLINEYSVASFGIICHRARELKQDIDSNPLPYGEWPEILKPTASNENVFPTSGGGVLYPPNCFHSDVTKVELFTQLSPNADDLWLYWMHRMNGYHAKKVGRARKLIPWPGSQKTSLKEENLYAGGNDKKIKALIAYYGFPSV